MRCLRNLWMLLMLAWLNIFTAGCHRTPTPVTKEPVRWGLGGEWLTLKPREKALEVTSFLDGWDAGQRSVCDELDSKTKSITFLKPMRPGKLDPADWSPCDRLKSPHTKRDFSDETGMTSPQPYISVLDDFYKHPECRDLPYEHLLKLLDDEHFMSGDQLFRYVRAGKGHLGAYSGFNLDDCFPHDEVSARSEAQ